METMSDDRWLHPFNDYANVQLRRAAAPRVPASAARRTEPAPAPVRTRRTAPRCLALRYRDGVIMAGDRQATAGYQVASRRIEKIFKADDLSGVGIAGAAGPGHGDGQALPDRARALREGRGREPLARRQGQQAGPDDPHEPAGGHAGPRRWCRSSRASTRRPAWAACSSTTSPAAATRSATTTRRARARRTRATR